MPDKLYPIFRDRDELAVSGALPERIRAALAASDHLVVLCRPHAAASPWVNQEVAAFREMGGTNRIHAVLADGEPVEAFPPALTAAVDEPVAADLRKSGDGWTDGPLKLIAGLLGLDFGELKDREVARARFRARIYAAVAGLFAILGVAAGIGFWQAVEQTRRTEAQLSRAEAVILTAVRGIGDLVDQVVAGADTGAITVTVADGLLQTAQGLVAGVVAQAPENRLLKSEEARLNGVLSQHYQRSGKLELALQAVDRAERIYRELESSGGGSGALRNRSVALDERGNTLLAAGNRAGALTAYEESLEIRRRLAAADPGNAGWQYDLGISHERIGDVLMAQSERALALEAYEAKYQIISRLAAADPGNAAWARDVSVSLDRIGDVRVTAGNRAGALTAFKESLEIRRRLAAADPGNAGWARDVSVSLIKVGDVRVAAGDRDGALTAYEEGLAIFRRLAAADPGNAGWARDVSVSLIKVGDVRVAEGDRAGALSAYEESLEIRRRLAAADPGNAGWAHDVSVSLDNVGDVRVAEGDRAGALTAYEESLEIRRRLAAADPGSAGWARDVSVSLDNVGDVRVAEGDRAGALTAYEESLEIRRRLAAADPGNAGWARDLIVSHVKIAAAADDASVASEHYAAALKIAEDLATGGRLAPTDAWVVEELRRQLADTASR